MYLVFEIYALFFVFAFKSIFEGKTTTLVKKYNYQYLFLVILIALVTGLRDKNLTTDYLSYEYMFDIDYNLIEPTFIGIRYFTKNILHGTIKTVMLIYAFIAIPLKWKAIKTYSTYIALSFVVFLGDLFMQQDFTQIRAAVALSIFLLSLNFIYTRNAKKYFLMVLLATLFHTSSLLMIPLYFLNTKKINKYAWYSLIVLGYLLTVFHFNPMAILAKFMGGYIGRKLIAYTSGKGNYSANVFSIYSLSKLVILTVLYWKINIIKKFNKYSIFLLKVQSLSIISLCFFSQNRAAALRISEFYSIADILLFPLLITVIKEKTTAKIILISFSLFWLTMRIFRYHLILV